MDKNILKNNVYSVGANDFLRKSFDELIPLPDGTSYNSYLVVGLEKTALIDTVDPTMNLVLLKNLKELEIKKIDYIIANHAEQDHSGTIPYLLKEYPMAKILCSVKCKPMLVDLLEIDESIITIVQDNDKINLGGKTLKFVYTPWVHWPETMCTYLIEDKILFSSDFFGSHLANEDIFFNDKKKLYQASKRYYAEIMMPFRNIIKENISKLEKLDISMIAPSHGPVYKDPKWIIDNYKDWITDEVKNQVLIAYVSMHGSTKEAVQYLGNSLKKKGIDVKTYNLANMDLGELAIDLVDSATIVVGTPCVLAGIHPSAGFAVSLVNSLRPKTRFVSIVGSFGWFHNIDKTILGLIPNIKPEILAPVFFKGSAKEKDLFELDRLSEDIYTKHKGIGIVD